MDCPVQVVALAAAPTASVVAAPAKLRVVDTVLKASKLAPPTILVTTVGVVRAGEVENTKLVEVVPVAPAAVYPVMLLKAVMPAEVAFVPPLATVSVPVVSATIS